jgi:hypothetical protein
MSIARGLTKAASAAKKQSRGLTGNRNSQGDFIPDKQNFEMEFNPEGTSTLIELGDLKGIPEDDLWAILKQLEEELPTAEGAQAAKVEDAIQEVREQIMKVQDEGVNLNPNDEQPGDAAGAVWNEPTE